MATLTGYGRPGANAVIQQIYPAVVNEDKTINYKLNPDDLTQKEDGTASVLDGTDGDVMIIIPDYWMYHEVLPTGKVKYHFSPSPLPGYTKIPKHAKGIYKADEDSNSKLRSRSNVTPLVNQTRDYFRQRAYNKGDGWCIEPYFIREADTLLAFAELLNNNSQSVIGTGATNASSSNWDAYNNYSPVWTTDGGSASSYGSGTVTATPSDPNTSSVRTGTIPIEVSGFNGTTLTTEMAILWWMRDVFGHIWEWVDGINVYNSSANGSEVFISNDVTAFADDTETNYFLYQKIAETDGYIEKFIPGTILPEKGYTNGGSGTYVGDYFYTYYENNADSGWRVARWGGRLSNGSWAGLCYAYVYLLSGAAHSHVGARLCLVWGY